MHLHLHSIQVVSKQLFDILKIGWHICEMILDHFWSLVMLVFQIILSTPSVHRIFSFNTILSFLSLMKISAMAVCLILFPLKRLWPNEQPTKTKSSLLELHWNEIRLHPRRRFLSRGLFWFSWRRPWTSWSPPCSGHSSPQLLGSAPGVEFLRLQKISKHLEGQLEKLHHRWLCSCD